MAIKDRRVRIEKGIEKLLKKRKEIEEEIKELGFKEVTIQAQKDSFDQEGKQFAQEMEKITALSDNKFKELRKVNGRIEQIKKPDFTGDCPGCGKSLDLENYPMLDLCIGCQQKENNKKR